MSYKTAELLPMTPEKDAVLRKVCRQWNEYMWLASVARRKYFKTKEPTHAKWKRLARYKRDRILEHRRESRSILEALARHALSKGFYGVYTYAPKQRFFLSDRFYRSNGRDELALRCTPLTELLFSGFGNQETFADIGGVHEIRVSVTREGRWFADWWTPGGDTE